VSTPLIEARKVTRILPGIVPATLVRDVDLAIGARDFVSICSGCSTCRPRAKC
jgi:lipoprotein-releasing system ATP-binding protein